MPKKQLSKNQNTNANIITDEIVINNLEDVFLLVRCLVYLSCFIFFNICLDLSGIGKECEC